MKDLDTSSHWGRWVDAASREQIQSLQSKKLLQQTAWVYANSPFWRKQFQSANITPEVITDIKDSPKLPYGKKEDYREAQSFKPPYGGLLCRSKEEIYSEGGFLWETSGTTGEPVQFLCSQREYYRTDVNATCRILWTSGLRPGDTLAMFWPLTLWAVGHGIIDAARSMNMTTLPLGPSYSTEYRLQKVAQYRPTVIMTTPSYALRLAEVAEEENLDAAELGTERVVVSGEPLTEATRSEISDKWGVSGNVYNYYGLSEAFNCRSIECEKHDGMHILEDLYLCQVISQDTGELLGQGKKGELVVTALEQRDIATGFHYRTGDIARYTDEPCECGRTTRRIEIISRKDDMRTIRGVNVFPQAVETLVRNNGDLTNEFRLLHEKEGSLDSLTVVVESKARIDSSDYPRIRQQLQRNLESALGGLTVDVDFVDTGELERFSFKADRWMNEK